MRVRRGGLSLGLLIAGTASTVSGFLIQFVYHVGHALRGTRLVWGWSYATWVTFHQVSSLALLGLAVWHLVLNRKALLAILKRRSAWHRQVPLLFALFALATVIALVAWGAPTTSAEHLLVEIHDKLVIPMAALLLVHVWQRRTRLRRPRFNLCGR
jgi:hypothetical protein